MASADLNQRLEPARWQRSLLPGTMVGGPGAGRSLRDWAVDAILVVGAFALGALALRATWGGHDGVTRFLDLVLGFASLAALWDRRRHPVGVAFTTRGLLI